MYATMAAKVAARTHLETLVLEHLLDGHILLVFPRCATRCSLILASPRALDEVTIASGHDASLEDDAEGAVTNDLAVGVGQLTRLARLAV